MITNDWIETIGGRVVYPFDLKPEDLDITDIAHALSMQCRWAGHCYDFFSVAQHCVYTSRLVSNRAKPWAFAHDWSEAYLVDVPRPIKKRLPQYKVIEDAIQRTIQDTFGIPFDLEIFDEVTKADLHMLFIERRSLRGPVAMPWEFEDHDPGLCLRDVDPDYYPWNPIRAKQEFLRCFEEVIG